MLIVVVGLRDTPVEFSNVVESTSPTVDDVAGTEACTIAANKGNLPIRGTMRSMVGVEINLGEKMIILNLGTCDN